MRVKIEVVKVEDECAASYQPRDVFYMNGFLIESEKPLCIHAVFAISHVAYALSHGMDASAFGTEEIFLSCPDPGKPYGDGKVIFRLEVVE
ncbi:TIGR04076 family protein [Geoglobus acetivorans]|uniref:TIGR04076 family protein n=1 Tax=Geoglobus acetivorans TaxID=565033 RepID=A0ABZ3H3V6_GEOAI|nr:TIGR04076 family protein [Geoglobus acetivorans]